MSKVITTKTSVTKNHWSLGLVNSMNNSKLRVINTDLAVVIKDAYPKAKYHFLVLPWEDIPTIYHLQEKHKSLLDEIELLAINAIEITGKDPNNFKIGYHASPSMQRLHLHVISKDFDSHCLKTKVHWNSFNTKFFLPVTDVHNQLKVEGKVRKFSEEQTKEWISTDLLCNQCDFKPKNMPNLKQHLKTHLK